MEFSGDRCTPAFHSGDLTFRIHSDSPGKVDWKGGRGAIDFDVRDFSNIAEKFLGDGLTNRVSKIIKKILKIDRKTLRLED